MDLIVRISVGSGDGLESLEGLFLDDGAKQTINVVWLEPSFHLIKEGRLS